MNEQHYITEIENCESYKDSSILLEKYDFFEEYPLCKSSIYE